MASPTPLAKANTSFCLDLFKKLGDDSAANVFFSPFSISSALSMVFLGAAGNTAKQMSEVNQTFVQDLCCCFVHLVDKIIQILSYKMHSIKTVVASEMTIKLT